MDFRILGPLEAVGESGTLPLGAAKQRAVLAVLLLHANRVVSRDRLVDAVWDADPPETATTALQVYVSGLRKVLGAERLVTRAPGYLLAVEPGSTDIERVEALAAEAHGLLSAGDAGAARERLVAALATWRGEPLADLDAAAFVVAERQRLEELRLALLEDRVEADFALGRHAEVVPELSALVREEPLRERLRAQLMLALYRSGRQAEALDVYASGRRLLSAELGLEPGEALQRLQRAILAQDPVLAAPSLPSRRPVRRRQRPVVAMSLLGAVLAVGAVAGVLVLARDSGVTVAADSLALIDPASGQVLRDVRLEETPLDVAVGFDSAWVTGERGTVMRVDADGDVVARIDVGAEARDVAVSADAVWITDGADGAVIRIDPAHNVVEDRLRVGEGGVPLVGLAVGPQGIWTTRAGQLLRIDPDADRVVSRFRIPATVGLAVDPDDGIVWLVTQDERLLEFVPGLGSVVGAVELEAPATAPVVSNGAVWMIVYSGRGEIWRFDGTDTPPQVIAPGREAPPLDIAVAGRELVTVDGGGAVVRRDAISGRVLASADTTPTVRASIAVGYRRLWAAVQQPT